MQYLLLIYNREQEWLGQSPEALDKHRQGYMKLSEDLAAKKQLVGANRLQSVSTATTVRVVDGKPQMTDGPFAETREQLGGYYLIEAANLDEATAIAARIPTLGSVEVRPIHSM